MRPFIKKELMDIFHFHVTLDTFVEKFAPKSAMPIEYGGSAGNEKTIRDQVYEQVQANAAYFEEEESTKRVNEKLRQGKPHGEGDIFGIDGTFKQLSFD